MRTYINVPYADKDEAKKFGAKWDFIKKMWYIENMEDITVFEKWFREQHVQNWEGDTSVKKQPKGYDYKAIKQPKRYKNKLSDHNSVTTGEMYQKFYSNEVPWKE
jgi:hypothetical protein